VNQILQYCASVGGSQLLSVLRTDVPANVGIDPLAGKSGSPIDDECVDRRNDHAPFPSHHDQCVSHSPSGIPVACGREHGDPSLCGRSPCRGHHR
jgi:hypothetical protein